MRCQLVRISLRKVSVGEKKSVSVVSVGEKICVSEVSVGEVSVGEV